MRLAAVSLLAAGVYLIRAEWWGGEVPAVRLAAHVREKAIELYRQDLALQKAAKAEGQTYQPDPAEDLLEKALRLMEPVSQVAPLDRELLRLKGALALHFDDKFDLVDRTFALERALDPTWVELPLRQAEALARPRPQEVPALWQEALSRAGAIDRLTPETDRSKKQTLLRIRNFAKNLPDLENEARTLE
jgi:hypothetical protein